jgi:hypothetical protein
MILNALRIRPTTRSTVTGSSVCQAAQPARAHAGAAADREGPAFWTERMVRGVARCGCNWEGDRRLGWVEGPTEHGADTAFSDAGAAISRLQRRCPSFPSPHP